MQRTKEKPLIGKKIQKASQDRKIENLIFLDIKCDLVTDIWAVNL
jgi:hypothetical protein